MPTQRYDLSRSGSVTLAVRAPRELARQLRQAADLAGIDVSTYMRNALFAAPDVTATAVVEIKRAAAAGERERALSEIQSLRDHVAGALQESAIARDRIATLERDLRQPPLRLLALSNRVLRGETDGREDFANAWEQLNPAAQTHLLPALLMAIREFLIAMPEAISSREELARHRRLLADVDWLASVIGGARGGNAGDRPALVTETDASEHAGALAIGRDGPPSCATPSGGGSPPSLVRAPASLGGSHLEGCSSGAKTEERGQVASSAQFRGFEVLPTDGIFRRHPDLLSGSATVVGASGPRHAEPAAPRKRDPSQTS